MKKLYQGKGRRVHPAPAPGPHPADASAVALAMLPATLLALVAALTAEEQEVLAYLLSGGAGGEAAGSGGGRRRRLNGPHQPEMGCGCFGCYKSFWARWDASPNRHLIHRIIDAVEEGSGGGGAAGAPGAGGPGATRRSHRRRRRGRGGPCAIDTAAEEHEAAEAQLGCADDHLQLQDCCASDGGDDGDYEGDEDDGADSVYGGEEALTDDNDCANANASAEKSAVGKLVRFIGEKVWAAWT